MHEIGFRDLEENVLGRGKLEHIRVRSSSLRDIVVSFTFIFLPILSVLGSIVLRNTGSNMVLLMVIGLVAIISLVTIAWDNVVPSKYYPLAIVAISISLSLHYVLISPNLVGWDVNREYYFFRTVSGSGHWDSTFSDPYNSALSVTILPTMLWAVLGIDGVLIFKVIFQLIFSLVPLILYVTYREQIGARTAFLSMIFMMSFQSYYMELTSVTRQEIAEVLLACLVLLMMKREKQVGVKYGMRSSGILMMLMVTGLTMSHYSTSYIFMFYAFAALIVLHVFRVRSRLTATFVMMTIIVGLVWYLYTAGSESFNSLVRLGSLVSSSMFLNFFDVGTRGPMVSLAFGVGGSQDLVHAISHVVFYLIQLFIVVGVFKLLRERRRTGINNVLIAFSIVSIVLLAASVILPFFSDGLNMSRIYDITLLFLAPACVLGGETLFDTFAHLWAVMSRSSLKPWLMHGSKGVVAFVIVIFLLFNTGFVYEIAMSSPSSISLSFVRMKRTNDVAIKAFFYSAYVPTEDAVSARWVSEYVPNSSEVCGDLVSKWGVLFSYAGIYVTPRAQSHGLYPGSTDRCVYVYLSYLNVLEHIGTGPDLFRQTWQIDKVSSLLQDANTIYSNGGSEVLLNTNKYSVYS